MAFRRAKPKMGRMEPAQRRRLVTDLQRLSRTDFEALVDEVRTKANTEEQFAAALGAALHQRAAEAPFPSLSGLAAGHDDEE